LALSRRKLGGLDKHALNMLNTGRPAQPGNRVARAGFLKSELRLQRRVTAIEGSQLLSLRRTGLEQRRESRSEIETLSQFSYSGTWTTSLLPTMSESSDRAC